MPNKKKAASRPTQEVNGTYFGTSPEKQQIIAKKNSKDLKPSSPVFGDEDMPKSEYTIDGIASTKTLGNPALRKANTAATQPVQVQSNGQQYFDNQASLSKRQQSPRRAGAFGSGGKSPRRSDYALSTVKEPTVDAYNTQNMTLKSRSPERERRAKVLSSPERQRHQGANVSDSFNTQNMKLVSRSPER